MTAHIWPQQDAVAIMALGGAGGIDPGALAALSLVQLLVGVGVYVWLALALMAVFRKVGVAPWKAWVPVLNGWELFVLGGMRGWWAAVLAGGAILVGIVGTVVGGLFAGAAITAGFGGDAGSAAGALAAAAIVPALIWLAFLVFAVIVQVRLMRELCRGFGVGTAYIVLGVILFPVWASVIGWGSARWLGRPAATAAAPFRSGSAAGAAAPVASGDASASSTADGSSMMMSFTSCESARAIATICLLAALNWLTSTWGERAPCPSRRRSSRVRAAASPRRVNPPRESSCPRKMFSAMVRPSTTSSSWYIVAMPIASPASGSGISTTSPSHRISPSSGRWTPARVLMSVDLPAPFCPRMQWTSPARTSRSTPRSARTPAKAFVTPRTSSNDGSWSTLITR